jgi:hypothetical protein
LLVLKVYWKEEAHFFEGIIAEYVEEDAFPFEILYKDDDVEYAILSESKMLTEDEDIRPYTVLGSERKHAAQAAPSDEPESQRAPDRSSDTAAELAKVPSALTALESPNRGTAETVLAGEHSRQPAVAGLSAQP